MVDGELFSNDSRDDVIIGVGLASWIEDLGTLSQPVNSKIKIVKYKYLFKNFSPNK